MYGCENWTIKKVECRRIDTSELWCWRLLRSLGLQGDPTSPFKGNQSWIFIGRTGAETETNTLATWYEELTHKKRPWCWERLKAGEGNNRGWDGWMASLSQWTWVWVNSGVGDRQGSLACCSPWGHQESDMTERLNWTDGLFNGFKNKWANKIKQKQIQRTDSWLSQGGKLMGGGSQLWGN